MKKITFLMFFMITALAATAQSVFINELHYDNAGGDVGEFVEIAGPAGTDLSGWVLEAYNGSNGDLYTTVPLTGVIANQSNGFGTLSFPVVLQNGGPDGIALIDGGSNLVQFLSYEGSFTADADNGGVAGGLGATSTDIGVQEDPAPAIGNSLQLIGVNGMTYSDFTWSGPSAESPGTINAGQTFMAAGPPPAGQECSTVGAVIPALMPNMSQTVTIPITSSGTIGENTNEIEFVSVDLNDFQHGTVNELVVTLTAPDGTTTATLFANDGGLDGLDTVQSFSFVDGGADVNDWDDAATGFNPPFQAESGPFNGEMGVGTFQGVDINGDWTLTIFNGGNDSGSLAEACLTFVDRGLVGTVPVISCPEAVMGMGPDGTLTVDNDPGQCGAVISFSDASAVDAEDGPLTVTRTDMTGLNSDDEFPVGTTVLTFEATDSDGNTVSCDFTVVVNDVDAPTVTCPDDITVGNDTGDCGAIVTVPAPVFMDNCPVDPADVTNDYNAGGADATDFYPVGTTTVTYSYTDSGANTITCSVDITVEDTEAPVIACEGAFTPSPATVTTSPGTTITTTGGVTYTETIDVPFDVAIEDVNVNLDIAHTWVGDLEITLTSPDGTSAFIYNGDQDGCSGDNLQFIVDDESANVLSSAVCDGQFGTPNQAYAEDNYQPSAPAMLSDFDGEMTAGTWTFTVFDDAGGDGGTINSLGLTFTFDDSNPPTPFPVTLMADGTATIPVTDLVDVTDNCGTFTVAQAGVEPCADTNPSNNYENAFTAPISANDFTVDANTDFTLTDVTLGYIIPAGATVSSVALTFHEDNAGAPGAQIGDEMVVPTQTVVVTGLFGGGFDGVTLDLDVTDFTFTNNTGAEASFWITADADVSGTHGWETTTASQMGSSTYVSLDGGATFVEAAAGTDGVYSYNGLCGAVGLDPMADPTMVNFTCENVGSNNIEINVTDDAGNVSTCTAVVEVTDDTAPELVCMDFTIELDDNGVATLDPNDAIDEDATVEACGYEATASRTDFSCADIGTPVMVDIFV
ncbi:proprotein convertase P-domain-containing protein, partial [Jejudonia soesokkakensis]